ncbi:hypothetical protein [Streptomyces sp. NPDC006355]
MDVSNSREWIGNHEFMKQLDREYNFPVLVYKINEDNSRDLVRIDPA